MNKARRFVIETPLGKLEVYAKHDKSDCAEDLSRRLYRLCTRGWRHGRAGLCGV